MRQHRRQWDRGFRQGGYITGTIDTRQVDKFISELRNGKQGRRLIRNASRVALELFNEETGNNARELDLKPSGKKWRRLLGRRTSYAYRAKMSGQRFQFWTGVNYKKPVLRISHLVERGFRHAATGKRIAGQWFRREAFQRNQRRVMRRFADAMSRGADIITATGKAPSVGTLRRLEQ